MRLDTSHAVGKRCRVAVSPLDGSHDEIVRLSPGRTLVATRRLEVQSLRRISGEAAAVTDHTRFWPRGVAERPLGDEAAVL